jgi:hypothetical protein
MSCWLRAATLALVAIGCSADDRPAEPAAPRALTNGAAAPARPSPPSTEPAPAPPPSKNELGRRSIPIERWGEITCDGLLTAAEIEALCGTAIPLGPVERAADGRCQAGPPPGAPAAPAVTLFARVADPAKWDQLREQFRDRPFITTAGSRITVRIGRYPYLIEVTATGSHPTNPASNPCESRRVSAMAEQIASRLPPPPRTP